jgi:3-phenylpropionate/trans-cinnamate dioxygenase ferredoxin subunit
MIRADELEDGKLKAVAIAGHELLLAKVEGSYYAARNLCPHMGARLSEGTLDRTVVTCPRHGSQFDLATGQVVRWLKGSGVVSALGKMLKSPQPLEMYKVKVDGGMIMVEI